MIGIHFAQYISVKYKTEIILFDIGHVCVNLALNETVILYFS